MLVEFILIFYSQYIYVNIELDKKKTLQYLNICQR